MSWRQVVVVITKLRNFPILYVLQAIKIYHAKHNLVMAPFEKITLVKDKTNVLNQDKLYTCDLDDLIHLIFGLPLVYAEVNHYFLREIKYWYLNEPYQ